MQVSRSLKSSILGFEDNPLLGPNPKPMPDSHLEYTEKRILELIAKGDANTVKLRIRYESECGLLL